VICLVTDSNGQLPIALQQEYGVLVVPMTVVVDGVAHLEGVDLDLAGITAALKRGAAVGSSTPSPGQFLKSYEQAADEGATQLLSIHAGGGISGVANTARLAASMSRVPVEVVDTGSASFPVALCVWAAGEVLAAGGDVLAAAEAARRTAEAMGNVFVVGTLALAVGGGRLARAAADLAIPVLALAQGGMTPVGRVGDVDGAVKTLVGYVREQSAGVRLRIGVGHLGAAALADALESGLREACDVEQLVRYDMGPSVAVHVGMGTVGCVFHPA